MKIVFIGCVQLSYATLETLVDHKFEIVGVVTKKKSSFNSDFKDLTPLAEKVGCPIFYYDKNDDDLTLFIEKTNADIIYCFGWSHLLPESVFSITKHGAIGFHPAKLPMNRGRHPLIWALVLGLEETATSFFFIEKEADTGDIISQENISISLKDDATSLYKKIIAKAQEQVLRFSREFAEDKIQRVSQRNENSNYWRKRTKEDGLIDWKMSALGIYNLVRALTHPYIGASFLYKDNEVKVWKVRIEDNTPSNLEQGKVLQVNSNEILIKCMDKGIWLLEHELKELPKVGDYIL